LNVEINGKSRLNSTKESR